MLDQIEAFSKALSHDVELGSYKAEVDIFLANEAEDQVVYRFCYIVQVVSCYEQSLQLVVFESFGPKFDVLVAYICEDGCLRMDLVVFASLCDNAALNVAEQTINIMLYS